MPTTKQKACFFLQIFATFWYKTAMKCNKIVIFRFLYKNKQF